jgi:hypothetical protein
MAIIENLTENEKALLLSLASCQNTPTNGCIQSANDRSDISSWLWLTERDAGDAKTNAAKRGVLGSLTKKKLLDVYPDGEGDFLVNWSQDGFDTVKHLDTLSRQA